MKLPRAKARTRSACPDCKFLIQAGMWVYKDIDTNQWLHRSCWWARINARKAGRSDVVNLEVV